jgi:sensor domain CHASE-containing protein
VAARQYAVWRADARDHVREVDGLEELQWLGPDYRVNWAEGTRRSGWVENRDLNSYSGLAGRLAEAAEKGAPFVTEPREFAPGESAFIVYVPLMRAGQFDGFLVAVFSSRGFFRNVLDPTAGNSVAFRVKYGGVTFFDNGELPVDNPDWTREIPFQIQGRPWSFVVSASRDFVDTDSPLLPVIVLVAGLLIAVLSSVLVRYVTLARLRMARLQASTQALAESDERHALVMRGLSVGVWEWDVASNKMIASEKSREILGIPPGEGLTYEGFAARLHPDDKGRVERAIFGHVRGVEAYDTEFRLRRNDGEYVWVHASGQARMREDWQGRPHGGLDPGHHAQEAATAGTGAFGVAAAHTDRECAGGGGDVRQRDALHHDQPALARGLPPRGSQHHRSEPLRRVPRDPQDAELDRHPPAGITRRALRHARGLLGPRRRSP